ncbi:MAG: hypothetical protein C4584_01985 [Armatimonadetes bacterium]|nr:MAG: hypothetical protein C4584_01985 [Armatimonadota bacterium]
MNQKGLSSILIIILVIVSLFVIGQVIYSLKLIQVKPPEVRQEDISINNQNDDLGCKSPVGFSLDYPKEATVRTTQFGNPDSPDKNTFCFYTLGTKNGSISIAPTGKYGDRPAYGAGASEKLTKQPYKVKIASIEIKGEVVSDKNQLDAGYTYDPLKAYDYDFFITFKNKEGQEEIAKMLQTFKSSK